MTDDSLTASAIGALAFVSTTIAHEAVGHGVICLSLGGRIVLYPVSMQCTESTPWMVLAGPLTNAIVGVALWIILGHFTRAAPVHLQYFLWLTMAFNLFNAAGYLFLGAATGFGDWGVLMKNLPVWVRLGLAPFAGLLYYGCMHAVASRGRRFLGRLPLQPYLAAGGVAVLAALLSPLGPAYIWVAVAASFGAGLGLLAIHDWGGSGERSWVSRSYAWVGSSSIVSSLFVIFVGRGLE